MKTEKKIIKKMLAENKDFTIRQLAKEIKSDYKITHTAVGRLLDKNILNREKIGKSTLCRLNKWKLQKELLSVEYDRAQNILQNRNIKQIYKEILSKIKTSFFIMVLFGSYAKGSYRKNSDIDLMFISNDEGFEKDILGIVRLIPLKIHVLVFNEKEFLRMADSKESNVVKEAVGNYVVLYGVEIFYSLMER